jgi:hypothetical protein
MLTQPAHSPAVLDREKLQEGEKVTDYERVIDQMYAGYMETEKRTGKERKHPSREEFGRILKYAQCWTKAYNALTEKTEVQDA